jgi:hypothetical protein
MVNSLIPPLTSAVCVTLTALLVVTMQVNVSAASWKEVLTYFCIIKSVFKHVLLTTMVGLSIILV